MMSSIPRPQLLAPPYRVATNPGQDEQEAGSQGQEHQNNNEQGDAEAGGTPGLMVERQIAIPESHAVTRPSAGVGWLASREPGVEPA